MTSRFASVRFITADVARLVAFYEQVTGVEAVWATPEFAEIATTTCVLAFGSTRTLAFFGPDVARPADNHSLIVEFLVADVDAEHDRLRHLDGPAVEVVAEPADMPWGNRSLLLRDPDGSLVNLFTPVTDQAIARWSARSGVA